MAEFDGDALGEEAVRTLYYYVAMAIGPRMYRLWQPSTLSADLLEQYRQAPIYRDIQFLVRIANGEVDRRTASEEFLDETLAALQQVGEDLRRPPLGSMYDTLSGEQPQPLILQVLERVRHWLLDDELISLSEAAALYTGRLADLNGIKVIERLIAKWEQGKRDREGRREGLEVIIDPFEPNPQHRKRVRRSDVERLKKEQEQKRREKASQ